MFLDNSYNPREKKPQKLSPSLAKKKTTTFSYEIIIQNPNKKQPQSLYSISDPQIRRLCEKNGMNAGWKWNPRSACSVFWDV